MGFAISSGYSSRRHSASCGTWALLPQHRDGHTRLRRPAATLPQALRVIVAQMVRKASTGWVDHSPPLATEVERFHRVQRWAAYLAGVSLSGDMALPRASLVQGLIMTEDGSGVGHRIAADVRRLLGGGGA